jgi:hypothetical protein
VYLRGRPNLAFDRSHKDETNRLLSETYVDARMKIRTLIVRYFKGTKMNEERESVRASQMNKVTLHRPAAMQERDL